MLNPYSLGRAIVRTLGEAVKEVYQARQQQRRGIVPRMHRGGTYPFLRAATNVVMRDLNLALVSEQMLRGTPVIYVDFLDYDEIAHHSGPERSEAIHSLEGIDRALARLERSSRPARGRIGSSSSPTTARARARRSASGTARRSRSGSGADGRAYDGRRHRGEHRAAGPAVRRPHRGQRSDGAVPSMARRVMADQTRNGVVEVGQMGEERQAATEELPDLVVCASGNLAQVYFGLGEERLTREQIEVHIPASSTTSSPTTAWGSSS